MGELDDFEHQLLLSAFTIASHALRCLNEAGLLDDAARASIAGHLRLLSEKAEAIPEPNQVLPLLDLLVRILPPPAKSDN